MFKGEVDLEGKRKRGNFIHTSTFCNIDNTSIYISLEMATSLSFTINENEGERATHTHIDRDKQTQRKREEKARERERERERSVSKIKNFHSIHLEFTLQHITKNNSVNKIKNFHSIHLEFSLQHICCNVNSKCIEWNFFYFVHTIVFCYHIYCDIITHQLNFFFTI